VYIAIFSYLAVLQHVLDLLTTVFQTQVFQDLLEGDGGDYGSMIPISPLALGTNDVDEVEVVLLESHSVNLIIGNHHCMQQPHTSADTRCGGGLPLLSIQPC